MRSTIRARVSVVALVLTAGLAGMAPPAPAAVTTVIDGQIQYTGVGSRTRTFLEGEFAANIPDILAGAGKIRVGFALETTTTANVRSVTDLDVALEGDLQPGRPMTIRSARASHDFLGPELVLTTRPVLRVVFDYEPDDTDPFECLPFAVTGAEPQETGDGDAVCGRFEIGLPDDATLLQADFVPPYAGGSVDLHDTREVFSIPVCAELAGLIGIGPLADVCAIRLNAQVTASLSAPDTGGYRSTTRLATDLVLLNQTVVKGGLALTDGETTRWPSADPVTQRFQVPCLPAGSPLYYRLDNNVYASRVDRVGIQAEIAFVVGGQVVVPIAVGRPFDLLGEGNTIDVTATHQALLGDLGDVAVDDRGPQVGAGGPYQGPEGSPIRLQAVGTGPGGSPGECEPTGVRFDWTFDDGTTATGAVVDKTFADNRPSPHQATLHATDAAGNTTSVPFTVAVANVAPTANITSPSGRAIVPLGSVVPFEAGAADPGTLDELTYAWNFGDGATRSVTNLDRTDSTDHRYSTACLCEATLDVSDPEASAPRQSVEVIVFDPAGKVTGGGGFVAAQGSVGVAAGTPYKMNASVQYDPGATVPRGLTDLDVPSAGLSVRASGFNFLVVRGSEATWEGTATVNGVAGYTFRATLVMGSNLVPTETSMTLWRPGITSPSSPDLRIGGPIDTGQLKTH